jgi:hypothetical protein
MPETVPGSDPSPQTSQVDAYAFCLRCDWTGETHSDACPQCEAPLYRLRRPAKPLEVTPRLRVPSSADEHASNTSVEVLQEEDDTAPAALEAVSRRNWVIVAALIVVAFWIVTTGGPFRRLQAQDVPPTASPQFVPPTVIPQNDAADLLSGGPIDLSGLDLARVNGDVTSAPAKSPDGRRVVFGARGGTIYSVIVRSNERSVLAHLPGKNLDSVDEIEWSPDGAHIAIMNDLEPGGGRLYVMNEDGTGVRVLLHNYEPQKRFVWSPGGKSIAYATRGPAGLGWYAIDADGARPPREIDEPTYLSWRHPGVPIH